MNKVLKNKSLKNILMTEALRALCIWILLLLAFGVFQIALYRQTQLGELQTQLIEVSKKQSPRIASFLSLNEEAGATTHILRSLKEEYSLSEVSISQSFFTHWPEVGCKLVNANTESCRNFFTGKAQLRKILEVNGESWYLQLNKGLRRPWGSQGWWAASLVGFGATMFILAVLFLRLILVLRNEVLLPAKEVIEVLSFSEKERSWWLQKRPTIEIAELAKKLFSQQEQLKQKSVLAQVGQVSTQVAHDIRGPLSLLQILTESHRKNLTREELTLGRQAVERIDKIVEELLKARKDLPSPAPLTPLTLSTSLALSPSSPSSASSPASASSPTSASSPASALSPSSASSPPSSAASPSKALAKKSSAWLIQELQKIFKEINYKYSLLKTSIDIQDLQNQKLFIKNKPEQFLRCIENLIKNSAEACALKAKKTSLRLSLKKEGDFLVVDILDTGLGMKPEHIEKLAVGQQFTTKNKGNGLGLTHAQELLKAQGGSLDMWSLDQGGSRFQIKYPLN